MEDRTDLLTHEYASIDSKDILLSASLICKWGYQKYWGV